MRDIHQRAGGPIDWDREWETVWKATARNPWFAYQADVYDAWLGPSSPAARVLKTDAFDEACGYGPLAHPGRLALLDVAPRILRQALGAYPDAIGCVADVRRLAFRDGAFDLVFSPSTLDHFEDPHDIDTALAELARVLHPGGRLLVTLDNPGNPLLAARRAIRRLTGPMRGLIPWPVGRTLSRARLVAALERAGLDVVDSGWVVHAPRLLGLWLGEWAARRGRDRLARRLRAAFNRIERAAARLPTGGLTAHFVVADCRRPLVPAPRPRGSRLVAAGTALWKRTEFRLRTAYLRRVPPPLVSLFDPPLRRVVGVGRRAAALPVYFRQRLALWSGPCAGGTA
ncbi:MAG TPA: class I SAM-dependent methyltransferase, partial [Candidatus Binatus sp.]|nr:class I SAM-dependent methyltransferase [Candidatus Binatus sp.]